MKKLTTNQGVFGPFQTITETVDSYLSDGMVIPKSTVTNAVISDYIDGDSTITNTVTVNQSDRWEAIKAIRDRKTQQGGYKVGNDWFHSDTFSRTQQLGLVMLGNNLPAGLQWKTMQGTFVTMTLTLAQQVFSAAATQDTALFAHAEYLRANQDADITQGWPETYNNI